MHYASIIENIYGIQIYFRQLTSKAAETIKFLYYFGSFNVSLLDAKVHKSAN